MNELFLTQNEVSGDKLEYGYVMGELDFLMDLVILQDEDILGHVFSQEGE